MPRIPDNEIERLKNEASGVELKKAGKDKLGVSVHGVSRDSGAQHSVE